MKVYLLVSISTFIISIITLNAHAFQVHNEELKFSLEVPEAFSEFDNLKSQSDARTRRFVEKNTLYAYNRGGAPEKNNHTGIFLFIEHSSKTMLAGLSFWSTPESMEILTESWQGRKINLYRVERNYNTLGDRLVTLTAAIPLAPEPIQVKLSGDIKDEPEMRALLRRILSSIDGEVSIYAYASWIMYGLIILFIGWVGLRIKQKSI